MADQSVLGWENSSLMHDDLFQIWPLKQKLESLSILHWISSELVTELTCQV
jgi:hypothetical protein